MVKDGITRGQEIHCLFGFNGSGNRQDRVWPGNGAWHFTQDRH